MAKYLADRSSTTLFVNGSLDSLLPQTSVARSIWHGVEQLDMSRFDLKYRNDAEGRPAIDPRRLVAVWILAMVRGVSSSVAVAELCSTDIEMRWMCGDAGPRKSCLSDFRTEHLAELADLSTQLLAALARSELLPGKELAVDGSVIKAASSCGASRTGKQLKRQLARLQRVITQHLAEADNADDTHARLKRRQRRYEQALAELSAAGGDDSSRVTVSEPEASTKRLKNGAFAPAHTVQVVTDLSSGAIITTEIIAEKNDQGQLQPQIIRAEAELDRVTQRLSAEENTCRLSSVEVVAADSAYHDTHQLLELEQRRIETFVPDRGEDRRPPGVAEGFLREAFLYDAHTDTMMCPHGHALRPRKLNAGKTAMTYEARAAECLACPSKRECCPSADGGRSVNRPLYPEMLERVVDRVRSARGRRYRHARSVVAEGAFGRLIDRLHWRRCRTWGRKGARAEALWRQITNNLMLLLGEWRPLVPRTSCIT